MYESYWGLDRKPFDPLPSPRFYFGSEEHQGAELKLRYALQSRHPAAMLTGGPGMGKTLLLEVLAESPAVRMLHVVFPQLPSEQLLAYIAAQLTVTPLNARQPAAESLKAIEQTLGELSAGDQQVVLAVDEAHVLPPESLETLRLLLNFQRNGGASITLLLCGQSRLARTIQQTPGLDARFSVKSHLRPFDVGAATQYIRHRLAIAGAERPIFEREAVEELHRRAGGVPGRINRIADLALLIGYADELPSVGVAQVAAVDENLFSTPWAA